MVLLEDFFFDWNFQFSFFFQKEAILLFCVLAQHGIMHMMQVWGSTITAARSRSYWASHPWKATGHVHHFNSAFGSHQKTQLHVEKYCMTWVYLAVSIHKAYKKNNLLHLASVAFQSSGKGATSTDVTREMTFTNISSLNGHIHKHRLLESTLNLQLLPMKLICCTLR